MAKRESCLLILVKMVIMLAILIGAIIFLVVYTKEKLNEYFNRGENIVVPDFRGKHLVQVFKDKPSGLILEKCEEKSDFRIPKDHVISQDPPAGTKVKANKKVLLTISLGSKQVIVPDLKEKNIREAGLYLLNAQLREGNRAYIPFSKVSKDRIITQSPLPSSNHDIQQGVDVLISMGPSSMRAPLPNFVGKSYTEIKGILDSLGLKEGKAVFKKDKNHAKDSILATRPAPYEMVSDGAVVDIMISGGLDKGTTNPEEIKYFEVSDMTSTPITTPSTAEIAPPRIIVPADSESEDDNEDDQDDNIQDSTSASDTENSGQTANTVPVTFAMPDGFLPKEVKFILLTDQSRKEVYSGVHKPNDRIKVNLPRTPGGKVQIYINDVHVEERPLQ